MLELNRKKGQKRQRKTNPIIHKAPESKSTDTSARHSDDMRAVESLFEAIESNSSNIKHCTKLRKVEPSEGVPITKSRLIMITLDNEGEVQDVLQTPTKMKAKPSIKSFRVTPERNLEKHEKIRGFVNQAKKLAGNETGHFIHTIQKSHS